MHHPGFLTARIASNNNVYKLCDTVKCFVFPTLIKTMTLGHIICQITGINRIPVNVFQQSSSVNDMIDCITIRSINLAPWIGM